MKRNNEYLYSDISSFEDLRIEKEKLILKYKIINARIRLNVLSFRKMFSISNIILSIAKEFMFPGISDFLGDLSKKWRSK